MQMSSPHDATDLAKRNAGADVVLGDDWIAPDTVVEQELRESRARRSAISFNRSPLTRKIITFNLLALNVLVAGVLWLNSSRDSLMVQHANAMHREVELVASVFEASLTEGLGNGALDLDAVSLIADHVDLRRDVSVYVYSPSGRLIRQTQGDLSPLFERKANDGSASKVSVSLNTAWNNMLDLLHRDDPSVVVGHEDRLRNLIVTGDISQTQVTYSRDETGIATFSALSPIHSHGSIMGIVAMVSTGGGIDAAVREERERLLQMFVIATLVSVGLSIVLASTIANPISDLADAAEIGRARNRRNKTPGRIRIPDLTARPDEIGRLSGALRSMVGALYDRIDGNEQFAADVAHEIKNPLASLRSAVGSLRMVKKQEQKDKLLDIIEHDVQRLDRLVSDISNASRLDAELVKEEEVSFDLIAMVRNLSQLLGNDARKLGIEFISDLPDASIYIHGLEQRLAQVLVNLITNAISFCEDGDAIRVWVRMRENRVLVVVEDTGPGIPEDALQKIFKRFYTSRPQQDFGNNSGLGLAISKQIVEAHDGVIWAENIRPTEADAASEPLGARFVVGLPV